MTTPITAPISGQNGTVTYKIGAGAATDANISKWSFRPKANLIDRPNTTDGGGGLLASWTTRATLRMSVNTSGSADTDLVAGTVVTLTLSTDGTKKYTIAAILGDPEITNDVEGTYDMKVPFMMQFGKTLPAGPS